MTKQRTSRDVFVDERQRRVERHAARVAVGARQQKQKRWPKLKLTDFERDVLQKFQLGVKEACSGMIWAKIIELVSDAEGRELTGIELESRLRVNRSSISRERLTLEIVLLTITDLNRGLGDLELPNRCDRLLGGYQKAIDFAESDRSGSRRPLPPIGVWELLATSAVIAISNSKKAQNGKVKKKFTRAEWDQIADEAQRQVGHFAQAFGIPKPVTELPPSSGDEARSLRRKWGHSLIVCGNAIPKRWFAWAADEK